VRKKNVWANRAAKIVLRSCALHGENKDQRTGTGT
jgi:hypothetical protein